MASIEENLQTLRDIKAGIKTSLESQNKEPTDEFATYSGLVDALENPDDVTYCVTLDGENKVYAQLHGQEKVELTATANDIRINTSAITGSGYTEGEKTIPGYITRYGYKVVTKDSEATIVYEKGCDKLLITIAPFSSSVDESVGVNYVSIDNAVYEVSGTKLSNITMDEENSQIKLGVTVSELSILRYFMTREEA